MSHVKGSRDVMAALTDLEEINMAANKKKMVSAVFRDRFNAHSAYSWLTSHGYNSSDINLLMAESTKAKYYSNPDESPIPASTHVAEGAAAGGAIGTAVGATAAAIAAIGTSIALPGIGVVAGPLAAALAGGGAGAVTGGVIGALVGMGIPESNAKAYEEALRDGGIVIGVAPHSAEDAAKIKDKFKELKGENIITV